MHSGGILQGFQSMDGLVVRQHHAQKCALPSESSGGLNMERKRRTIRYTIFPCSSNINCKRETSNRLKQGLWTVRTI